MSVRFLDSESGPPDSDFRGNMPDSTNIGPYGHGLLGPVFIRTTRDSLVIVGKYAGDQSKRLRPAVLLGTLLGVAVGFVLTRKAFETDSFLITLGAVLVMSAFTFAGALLPMALVKRGALRSSVFAELSLPLTSVDVMGSKRSETSAVGGSETELPQPLVAWLMKHLSSRREVLLSAPTETRGRQALRIVMQDAAMAERLRDELQRRKSSARQHAESAESWTGTTKAQATLTDP